MYNNIDKSSNRKRLILIYTFSLLLQIVSIMLFHSFLKKEIIINDPRFEQLAVNIIQNKSIKIEWGLQNKKASTIMKNPYEIQKGVYYNWFPMGYAIILIPFKLLKKNYTLALTCFQLLVFSFIPVLIFRIAQIYFSKTQNTLKKSLIVAILFSIYPYFLISSLWRTDTWTIVLLLQISFFFFLKVKLEPRSSITAFCLGIILSVMFFFRPIVLFPFIILVLMLFIKNYLIKKSYQNYIIILSIVIFTVTAWTIRNYIKFNIISITQSNVGYNLWLGNNEYTNSYLENRMGDASTIEDDIIPKFDANWSFLKNYSEYEKNIFFRDKALEFMKTNMITSIKNGFWKIIGFWSPFRMRTGHWSDSRIKNIVQFCSFTPLLIFSLLSIINFFYFKEYLINKIKLVFIIFLYMMPYLIFFSTSRFRTPIDFILLILSMDYMSYLFNNFHGWKSKRWKITNK